MTDQEIRSQLHAVCTHAAAGLNNLAYDVFSTTAEPGVFNQQQVNAIDDLKLALHALRLNLENVAKLCEPPALSNPVH